MSARIYLPVYLSPKFAASCEERHSFRGVTTLAPLQPQQPHKSWTHRQLL